MCLLENRSFLLFVKKNPLFSSILEQFTGIYIPLLPPSRICNNFLLNRTAVANSQMLPYTPLLKGGSEVSAGTDPWGCDVSGVPVRSPDSIETVALGNRAGWDQQTGPDMSAKIN